MSTDDDVTDPPTVAEPTADERRGAPPPVDDRRYSFGEAIGRGGMGEVTTAYDQIIRFMREARIQGRLDHPAIVPVYDLGRDALGLPFFVISRHGSSDSS